MLTVNNYFVELNEDEQNEIDGGVGIIVVAAIVVVGTLAVNEVCKRTTGKDIVTHVGNALSSAGESLQKFGEKLYND